jgi:hypothetical protein
MGRMISDKLGHIDEYIVRILNLSSKSIGDSNTMRGFTFFPLQTVLLAEYFYNKAKSLYISVVSKD